MSETSKSKKEVPNNVINSIAYGVDEKLKIERVTENEHNANVNSIPGIPMEIETESSIFTNETKDGKTAVIDKKSGTIIGYLDKNGTVNRKLEEIDRKQEKYGQDR